MTMDRFFSLPTLLPTLALLALAALDLLRRKACVAPILATYR